MEQSFVCYRLTTFLPILSSFEVIQRSSKAFKASGSRWVHDQTDKVLSGELLERLIGLEILREGIADPENFQTAIKTPGFSQPIGFAGVAGYR